MASSSGRYLMFATKAMADITGTLLAPPVVALLLREIYREAAFARWLFVLSLFVTFVFSLIAVVAKIRRYGQAYQKLIAPDAGR